MCMKKPFDVSADEISLRVIWERTWIQVWLIVSEMYSTQVLLLHLSSVPWVNISYSGRNELLRTFCDVVAIDCLWDIADDDPWPYRTTPAEQKRIEIRNRNVVGQRLDRRCRRRQSFVGERR